MERPQLVKGAMVNAILAGHCSQIRIPLTEKELHLLNIGASFGECHKLILDAPVEPLSLPYYRVLCPKGTIGDTIWVRETVWQAGYSYQTYPEDDEYAWCGSRRVHYDANGNPPNEPNRDYPKGLSNGAFSAAEPNKVWRKLPCIHMPRWACRLVLEITDVQIAQRADKDEEGNPVVPWEWVIDFKILSSKT